MVKCLLTAYFIGSISAEKYQNPFTCVKVTGGQRWDVFWDTVYCSGQSPSHVTQVTVLCLT